MVYTKGSNINIQEISSSQSNSSSRVTINENFKKTKKTIDSIWTILDIIYDYNSNSLGSIKIHSDVSNIQPLPGQILVFDGIEYVPKSVNFGSGGSGSGSQYLWELLDVEDFSYPLPDSSILLYNVSSNKFQTKENKFTNLKDVTYQAGIPQIFYKNNLDNLLSINIGGTGTFVKSNGTGITFGNIQLGDIGNISLPNSPSTIEEYVLGYNTNGSYSVTPLKSGKSGIRNYIPAGILINVLSGFQYIVHESFEIDGGEFEIDGGELIIL